MAQERYQLKETHDLSDSDLIDGEHAWLVYVTTLDIVVAALFHCWTVSNLICILLLKIVSREADKLRLCCLSFWPCPANCMPRWNYSPRGCCASNKNSYIKTEISSILIKTSNFLSFIAGISWTATTIVTRRRNDRRKWWRTLIDKTK